MLVTGKFQQSLIDRIPVAPRELPFSLATIDSAFLNERNLTRPIAALINTPSIQIAQDRDNLGTPGFLIRGFDAPILQNNRLQGFSAGFGARDDSFIERYEILRGPASIALGPIQGGGVINAVTKTPQANEFYDYELAVDQRGSYRGEFDFNFGQVSDNGVVSFRISGAQREFEFAAEELGRQEFAIRPVVELSLSDRTSALISVSYNSVEATPNFGFPLFNDGSIPGEFDPETYFGVEDAVSRGDDTLIDATIEHDFLDNLTLTVRGSYQDTNRENENNGGVYNYNYDDGLPGISPDNPIGYIFNDAFTQRDTENTFFDVQLAWDTDVLGMDSSFVIGSTYNEAFREEFAEGSNGIDINIADIDAPQFGVPIGGPLTNTFNLDTTLTSFYGEGVIRPVERISIVAGVRYDDIREERTGSFFPDPSVFDDTDTTYRIGVSGEVTEGVNIYGSYAQAFTPQIALDINGQSLGPEESESFEVGAKLNILDGKVQLNAAYFDTSRLNVAVPAAPVEIDGNLVFFQEAVDGQDNSGFEVSGDLFPIDGLAINFAFSTLEIDINDSEGRLVEAAVSDQQASMFASYTFSGGSVDGLKFGAGFNYFSERPSVLAGFDFPDYTTVNALVTYPVSESIELSLNVQNLLDEDFLEVSGASFGLVTGQSQFGQPRTVFLTLRGRL